MMAGATPLCLAAAVRLPRYTEKKGSSCLRLIHLIRGRLRTKRFYSVSPGSPLIQY